MRDLLLVCDCLCYWFYSWSSELVCLVFCMSLIVRCLRNHVGPAKTDFTRVVCSRQVLHTLVVLCDTDCPFNSGLILATLRVVLYVDLTSCRLNYSVRRNPLAETVFGTIETRLLYVGVCNTMSW